ncbi:flagellar filament capping protein FliD [Moellerella wisconsensis]|uniref:flagellar filament capping protein FliD n=1 Tax=Moellerella wisconsensis TaxID=158849 RepID=UPI003075FB8B
MPTINPAQANTNSALQKTPPTIYDAKTKSQEVQNILHQKEQNAITEAQEKLSSDASASLNNNSDLNIDSFLSHANKNKQLEIDKIQQTINKNTLQLESYHKFDTLMRDFQKSSEALVFSNNRIEMKASVDKDTQDFKITPSAQSPSSDFNLTVKQLAMPHQLKSQALPAINSSLGDTNTQERTVNILFKNGEILELKLTHKQTSPQEIAKAINAAKKGLTALAIPSDTNKSYLSISSTDTGSQAAISKITVNNDSLLAPYLDYDATASSTTTPTGMQQSQAAQDSKIIIDGVEVTRTSNTLTDVIKNTEISLLQSSNESVGIIIEQDNQSFVKNVTQWITGYNELRQFHDQATHNHIDADKRGPLSYNNPASNLMTAITHIMRSQFGEGKISHLTDLKIRTNNDNIFDIKEEDAASFQKIVTEYMEDFKQLFIGNDQHHGLAGEIKSFIDHELQQRGQNKNSALEQVQFRLQKDNLSLKNKITKVEETTVQKIEQLKTQFAQMQAAVNRFKDAESSLKLMTRQRND